ncbi:MAG TPA: hypothetical protein VEG37_02640 [Burkholderiales bacterium]|nr:hypothetical protein [Burkholderiales bacterium]
MPQTHFLACKPVEQGLLRLDAEARCGSDQQRAREEPALDDLCAVCGATPRETKPAAHFAAIKGCSAFISRDQVAWIAAGSVTNIFAMVRVDIVGTCATRTRQIPG